MTKLALCLATMVAAVGCAAESVEQAEPTEEGALLQAPPEPTILRDPNGVYFADVKANGTGCPAGTWQTSLSEDGQTFTTTFSAYETELDARRTISVKDCILSIGLHSPQGLSFSVLDFYYSGYAFLEKGVSGRQFASYYFQGNPVEQAEVRTTLVGPYDGSFLFSDQVPIADAVWSPCGVDRELNVVTRLRLQNGSPRANGYMNVAAVDASAKLQLRLAWRTCTPQQAAAQQDAGTGGGGTRRVVR